MLFEYFEGNYAWNMAVNTLADEVGTIADPMRAFSKVAHLSKADPKAANRAWLEAFAELGDTVLKYAQADEAAGHDLTAARKYHRAAMYYIRAERMADHRDPLRLEVYQRALAAYRKARVLGRDPIEFVEIPYKGGVMPALFLRAEGEGPRPTVIHLQGFDSIKETQYPYLHGYRPRGMNALIVDQPGAGEAVRLRGLFGEITTENYVRVLVDYLEGRKDVDAQRIGLAGISMGGYYAPRAACYEPRIKAVCAWGALYDAGETNLRRLANLQAAEAGKPPTDVKAGAASLPDFFGHALWTWGLDSVDDWMALARQMTLKGLIGQLRCPFLVTHGENDRQVPLSQAQAMVAEAGSANKRLKVFTADEGGDQHCQLDNRYIGADFVADWFSEVLGAAQSRTQL